MEIAVYGKGGIGKSTVCANLSAALAAEGHRVLQIGCDPKHDSTRLLTHGKQVETVLEYLRSVSREEEDPERVIAEGYAGVLCIEAGGPQPGVGCAGRGIISAFEFLGRHRVKSGCGMILYDVLGDVVCGGFAVPVRREYADVIFLVTSGEFMALYAANNILRGIRSFDGSGRRRVAGIIYNERKIDGEDGRVKRFADAVGLPVCKKVPRSNAFAIAEERKMPLMEMEGCEKEKEVFTGLAEMIRPDMPLFEAKPLSDEALETVVLGKSEPGNVSADSLSGKNEAQETCPDSLLQYESRETPIGSEQETSLGASARPPLYGCAFNGAATTAIHVTDAVVIAHAPRACAFYTLQTITSSGRKNLFNRGILMPSALSPHFESTDIGQAEAVFGGMDLLRERVKDAVSRRPGAVIVISSCVSGIIGDDLKQVESLGTPEVPVITIETDGDISGDYMHGIEMCMDAVADRLIDPDIRPDGRCVNIVNETGVSNNIDYNYRVVESLLREMDVTVNCRYLGDATADELRHFLKAPLCMLSTLSEDSLKRRKRLEERYGCRFLDDAFPVGFEQSSVWLRKTAAFFDRKERAEEIISRENESYEREIEKLRPYLTGRTVIMTTINTDLDWLLDAAVKAGMRFLWIGVLNYLHQELNITKHPEWCGEISPEFDWQMIMDQIERKKPDLVLSNYTQTIEKGDCLQDSIPMTPQAGFHSALPILRRWARLFETGKEGSWNNDRVLFEKYFS